MLHCPAVAVEKMAGAKPIECAAAVPGETKLQPREKELTHA